MSETENIAAPAEPVLFERVTPHIALVTLNRPAARNAINGAITQRMEEIVRTVESTPELRVAILTAAPGRAFCAGADLGEIGAGRRHLTGDGIYGRFDGDLDLGLGLGALVDVEHGEPGALAAPRADMARTTGAGPIQP